MKVVINNRYGGFSLSRKAFLRLRELGEKTALSEPDYGEGWDDNSGPRIPLGPVNGRGCFCRDVPRNSRLLIQVIKELGEDANGEWASLKVVTIPNGVEWYIEEYDGMEHVAEKHRIWS